MHTPLSLDQGQDLYVRFLTTPRKEEHSGEFKNPLRSRTVKGMLEQHQPSAAATAQMWVESALSGDRRVWVWSDQHFGHFNIIRYTDRPFHATEEMNETMYANYLARVQPDDLVLFGGDVSFGALEIARERLRALPGEKILVLGNHEFDGGGFRKHHVFDVTTMSFVFSHPHTQASVLVTHVPVDDALLPKGVINLHGHTHRHTCGPRHINMSVEHMDFGPMLLSDLLTQHSA
jgi:calcineurin-like phosphoesterase family protein